MQISQVSSPTSQNSMFVAQTGITTITNVAMTTIKSMQSSSLICDLRHCHVFNCCSASLCNKPGVLGRWTTNLANLHGNNGGILWYLYGGIPLQKRALAKPL